MYELKLVPFTVFATMSLVLKKIRGVPLAEFPPVPLTLEGSFLLHQFFRFDWKAWRSCADGERKSCADGERKSIAAEAVAALQRLERAGPDAPVRTALFSQLGHKGDLILIH